MKNLVQGLLFTAVAVFAVSAQAEIKIAVLDVNMVIEESDAVKKHNASLEKKFSADINKIRQLEKEIQKLQERFDKDGSKLAQAEVERMDLEHKQKVREAQRLSKKVNEQGAQAEQEMLQVLEPKLKTAIDQVVKDGGYDLIIQKGATVDVNPQLDISLRVLEQLNKLR